MSKATIKLSGVEFECEGSDSIVEKGIGTFLDKYFNEIAQEPEVMDLYKLDPSMTSFDTEFGIPFKCQKTKEYDLSWDILAKYMRKDAFRFNVGDSVVTKLHDGRECDLVCVKVYPGMYRFESRDCMGGETSALNLSKYLEEIWDNLPDALKEMVTPVERTHQYPDKKITTLEKIFVPAASEIFPPDKCYGDENLYSQLDWYKNPHNRVRAALKGNSYTHWYWASSPSSSNSSGFCAVNSNGNADDYYAGFSSGVAPFGLYINR